MVYGAIRSGPFMNVTAEALFECIELPGAGWGIHRSRLALTVTHGRRPGPALTSLPRPPLMRRIINDDPDKRVITGRVIGLTTPPAGPDHLLAVGCRN